jgi:hypothetical protein
MRRTSRENRLCGFVFGLLPFAMLASCKGGLLDTSAGDAASSTGDASVLDAPMGVADTQPATTADASLDAASDTGPLGTTICDKHGGVANAKLIAAAIVARVTSDCRIGMPITSLSPSARQHFDECFVLLIGATFQCPGVSYIAGTTTDSKNVVCRTMTNAHQGQNLRAADFDAFIESTFAELKAQGFSTAEIQTVAPVFQSARVGVVQAPTQPTKNTHCACLDGLYNGVPCLPDGG